MTGHTLPLKIDQAITLLSDFKTPPDLPQSRALTADLVELLTERQLHIDQGIFGKLDHEDACPLLRVTRRSRELISCVTPSGDGALPWAPGGTRDAPLWWLDALGVITGERRRSYERYQELKESKIDKDTPKPPPGPGQHLRFRYAQR